MSHKMTHFKKAYLLQVSPARWQIQFVQFVRHEPIINLDKETRN